MAKSPLSFFRGSAIVMTADLAATPTTGLHVPLSGDCHLQNLGWFATPERNLVFDITDFDESLPAPWEWDVKRLAASGVVAARQLTSPASQRQERGIALAMVRSYRERMAGFTKLSALDLWYTRIDAAQVLAESQSPGSRRAYQQLVEKARTRTGDNLLSKLTKVTKSGLRLRDQPPLIYRAPQEHRFAELVRCLLDRYSENLLEERRVLLHRFHIVDEAFKVVGVGSVGLRCSIVLLRDDDGSSLVLQIKEARQSVLEPHVGASAHSHQGHRVVHWQRLVQSASDLFLGWASGSDNRDYYVRQLRDMKMSVDVEQMSAGELLEYGRLCGWALARAHAKAGQPAEISGYLGNSTRFDEAIADFAVAYADQTDRDFAAFKKALRSGRLPLAKGPT
jgi:uncharacterized protein (DUF2252 family)